MDDLAIDINQCRTILTLRHEVGVPQLVIESLTGHYILPWPE